MSANDMSLSFRFASTRYIPGGMLADLKASFTLRLARLRITAIPLLRENANANLTSSCSSCRKTKLNDSPCCRLPRLRKDTKSSARVILPNRVTSR